MDMTILYCFSTLLHLVAFFYALVKIPRMRRWQRHRAAGILLGIAIVSGLFVILEIDWLISGWGQMIGGLAEIGWVAFEYLNGVVYVAVVKYLSCPRVRERINRSDKKGTC